ncbi:PSD1 and planctomycete cytochrome C domain-containing protein [Aureliella helgolandensis]|uniref:Planctomycete cytochrome C n=1 Tax=Aureliella helgolandensis TaxID=2527968 RepID=A0A518G1C5_9BACT|nr:PSD1 and planctomycete cytochrome C domain-containing protein [Aureliella helgolandensis]QDV22401.1 Planctomycete cytochrome C [Aureliella helgolandensis]
MFPSTLRAFRSSIRQQGRFTVCCARDLLGVGLVALLLLGLGVVSQVHAQADAPVDFNREIRPLLNEHCVSCHGGVKQAADISFVYRDQALTVIEPGDPAASYFLDRVMAEDSDERMPPAEHGRALNEHEIDLLRRWIAEGAEWGSHWAFVPPEKVELPVDAAADWSRSRLDHFILARLRQVGLEPTPAATPERWLRRVSLDLIGLPPSPEERAAFLDAVHRDGEAAYEAEVDRLLDSPAFGERWASVWLDAMRYADSRGLGLDGRRTIWKYRDWVIRAFNQDMPYDQFTIRQLAGDLLSEPTLDDLVATASIRLTQTNEEGGTDDEEFRVEAVIDRVSTTWQTWQGLSFGCVQCHAHPYDPIRHEEYYQFMAFFNNTADCDLDSDQPTVRVPLDDSQATQAVELDRQIQRLEWQEWELANRIAEGESTWHALTNIAVSTDNGTHVQVAQSPSVSEYQTVGTVAKDTTVTFEGDLPDDFRQLTAVRFTGLPVDSLKALRDSEWGFVISHLQLELLPGTEAKAGTDAWIKLDIARVVADEPEPILDPQQSLNPKSSQGFGAYSRIHFPRSASFILERPIDLAPGTRLRVALSQKINALGAFPLVAHRGQIAVSNAPDFSHWWSAPDRRAARQVLDKLVRQRSQIASVDIPIAQERYSPLARPTHVFDRGGFLSKTELVTAKTPAFLPPVIGSNLMGEAAHSVTPVNRLDLARWLVAPENPLTSRVMVNRLWAAMFGAGIVETQEDFGSSGANPTHPRLLDDLAVRFRTEMGWHPKALLREMALSSTYRQSSEVSAEKLALDPQNQLLSRGSRRRLSAETIRDQALALSGLLSSEQFGPPVYPPIPDGVWQPFQSSDKWKTAGADDADRYRRTIYTYTKRSIPFPLMASFDAPSREFCSVRRLPSNTPLQALMTMNDTTFVEAAQALAVRMLNDEDRLEAQLSFGLSLVTGREPQEQELAELAALYQQSVDLSWPTNEAGDGDAEVETPAKPLADPNQAAMVIVAGVLLNLDEVLSR